MTATARDYDTAVRAFWTGRDLQTQKQIDSGKVDAGARGAVTGGLHLTALHDVIADQFDPLVKIGAVVRRSGAVPLPGFYRRTKNWDIVVTHKDILVAAVECKSHVGPSFSNNFNNRAEEAIGNAADIWRAHSEGYLGPVRPWLGFVFVLERAPGSTVAVRDHGRPIYPTDPAFDSSSYTKRYQVLFERLVLEQQYDAACLISSVRGQGIHDEPIQQVSTQNLTAAIEARVAYIEGIV